MHAVLIPVPHLVQSRNVLSKKLMGGAKGIKKVRPHACLMPALRTGL